MGPGLAPGLSGSKAQHHTPSHTASQILPGNKHIRLFMADVCCVEKHHWKPSAKGKGKGGGLTLLSDAWGGWGRAGARTTSGLRSPGPDRLHF